MKYITKSIFTLLFWQVSLFAFSQGKYFEVASKKLSGEKTYYGYIKPANAQDFVVLPYKGKTKKELKVAVLNYIKKRPSMWVIKLGDSDERIEYGDFATIGDTSKCIANLVSSTKIDVIPESGQLKIYIGTFNEIYASLSGNVQFSISREGVVVSENDIPFNKYKFVQPVAGKKGGLAYPDSIYDPTGKIVNPVNKKIIEDFYDGYVADLKSYLDKSLK